MSKDERHFIDAAYDMGEKKPAPTPSMDDKDIPSPPTRSTEQYEMDKLMGIQPVGHPADNKG